METAIMDIKRKSRRTRDKKGIFKLVKDFNNRN